MALVIKDRVKETSTTTGTGTFTLDGAGTGYQSFDTAIGSGNTTYYTIAGQNTSEWEVGLGTVGSGTLARTTILASSNAGSAVNFSAGGKDVFGTYPAGKAIYKDASGVSNITSTDVTTALGYTPVTNARSLTINGTAYDLTADRTWSVGTVTSVAALTLGTTGTDLSSSVANGTTTPVITLNVPTASATNRGALSSTDWSTFNGKQAAYTNLTTIGSLANGTGWLYNNGSGTFSYSTPTKSDVGLGNVTNDAQTKAAIVPNTAPSSGQILVGNAGGTAYAPVSMSGDATLASTGAATLATVNSNVGSFTNASVTVNAKGLITAASSGTAPVTSVTGTAPVVSSGGTTPAISMAAATGSVNGYLTSTDWTTFNSKAPGVTFTTGYIPFGQGTTTLNQSANLFWDNSNARLGIGTSSPAAPLDIYLAADGTYFRGGSSNTARQMLITSSQTTNAGDTHTFNAPSSTGVLAFAINNTETVRIDKSGFITFNLQGAGGNALKIQKALSNNIYFGHTSQIVGGTSNDACIYASGSQGITFYTNNALAMTLNSNGLLGIGLTPSGTTTLLQVNSDALINSVTVGKGGGAVATNTAVGYQAINASATGAQNTAIGYSALTAVTSGQQNTAVGYQALSANTTTSQNTAVGYRALYLNTASSNTAIGYFANGSLTTGTQNVAIGISALNNATTSNNNTAIGAYVSYYNTTGANNTIVGEAANYNCTTGSNNSALGYQALFNNTTTVATLGAITGGSGYTDGTYSAVAMTPVSGATFVTYPTVNVTVSGGAVTAVTLVTNGVGASSTAATVLTVAAALIGGTGSGFSIPVATFATGANNTAVGYQALNANTSASSNVAVGYQAGLNNTTAAGITAVGFQALRVNTTGSPNTAFGYNSLVANTIGSDNTAVGSTCLAANTTGNYNVAIGFALNGNVTGSSNIAIGRGALANSGKSVTAGSFVVGVSYTILSIGTTDFTLIGASANTVGLTFTASGVGTGTGTAASNTNSNTAVGYQALTNNITGTPNTAVGYQALTANTNGTNNLALGSQALFKNTTGTYNIGLGDNSLYNITTSNSSIAIGVSALYANTSGAQNVAIGSYNAAGGAALGSNTIGSYNTAISGGALNTNISGNNNTAVGYISLNVNIASDNTALGYNAGGAVSSGTQNTILGRSAGASGTNNLTTGSNNIIIGYNAAASSATVSNEITLGNSSITSLRLAPLITGYTSAAPTIASAATIAPTKPISFVSGTTTIDTITAPAPLTGGGGFITLIPTGLWSTSTAGNIALATTGVVSKALILTWDNTTGKWYPSY